MADSPALLSSSNFFCSGCNDFVCQERASDVVKNAHAKLRREYKAAKDKAEFEPIWQKHCEEKNNLEKYAIAMQHLATDHWAKHSNAENRIEWCRQVCIEFFFEGGLQKALEKERRKLHSAAIEKNTEIGDILRLYRDTGDSGLGEKLEEALTKYSTITLPFEGKLRLLDVGSCYNPFAAYKEFIPLGIDICPATETVHTCDFLSVETCEPLQLAPDTVDTYLRGLPPTIHKLPRQAFHVVIFSLLLSYFPSCYQRWLCCQKAHRLLQYNGLLIIITPDSSHQNRHAAMIKSWKTAIQSMGFVRWRYQKEPHLHCMAFRKVHRQETSLLDPLVSPDMLYIPQDFSETATESLFEVVTRSEVEDQLISSRFAYLPGDITDSDSDDDENVHQ